MSEYVVGNERYGVTSFSQTDVRLRPANGTYWKNLVAQYTSEELGNDVPLTLHLTQLPPEVITVDAYVDYSIEYPRVEIQWGDKSIDISDKLSVNHPNPETPGLYALDFMVALPGDISTPIWRSWVSIEEAPLLRRVITPWNRENKAIADINRLVIEPQLIEALYEAGVPIYNFQQANANSAVGQFAVMQYKNARVFVKGGRLFVSGPRLPIGTEVTFIDGNHDNWTRSLSLGVICTKFNKDDRYFAGDIVSYCGSDYYALVDIAYTEEGSILPTSSYTDDGITKQCWVRGIYYTSDEVGVPDGEYTLGSLWATIDVNGYLFKMDLLRAFQVRHYWGHYNSKNFYDYAPGDLVSIVKDNVIALYQRNDTPIDEKDIEDAYRPGHYRNPHWKEVYSESNSTEITDPVIRPYTNATNAVVSKTYSAREESFRMYANLVGMPTELVDCLGAKFSVILWALLYRTRETYPGIKTAFNAMGMDITDLHRVHPSVVYSGESGEIGDIYAEIDNVREITKSVKADRVWTFDRGAVPPDDAEGVDLPPWISYSEDGNRVLMYKNGEWVDFHTFSHIDPDLDPSKYDLSVNNRYYRATANLLERLDGESALYFEDGKQWVDHNYYVGIALAFARMLEYEIPVYIYLRIKVYLATVGHTTLVGLSQGVVYHDAWAEPIGLKLFPGKLFDMAACSTRVYYPTVAVTYDKPNSQTVWEQDYDFIQCDGYRYYPFNRAVYIRLAYPSDSAGIVYRTDTMWTSRYTIGCLGDSNSLGTEDFDPFTGAGFKDASLMTVSDPIRSPDLYLCKGVVGCTLRISTSTLDVLAECLCWNYVFNDPQWIMDGVLPFSSWNSIDATFYGSWAMDVDTFKQSVYSCSSPDVPNLKYRWGDEDEPTLYFGGGMPSRVLLYDRRGFLIGLINVSFNDRMVLNNTTDYILRLKFTEYVPRIVLTDEQGNLLTDEAGNVLAGN